MEDCKPVSTPLATRMKFQANCPSPLFDATIYHSLVGSLLYLTHTQPNIAFVVNLCSRYLQAPHESHYYLKGTTHMGIHYATWSPYSSSRIL
jgi:hypothetical protein